MKQYTKVLFIGDPHFKTSNNDVTDLVIDQCLNHLDEMIKLHTTDSIICCIGGDLLDTHERLHQTPYNKMLNFIDKIRSRVFTVILVGNHDYENNQQFLSKKHWMNPLKEWKNVCIADTVKIFNDLIFVPYVPPGRFVEALNTLDSYDWKKSKCIFAHQEFRGCIMSSSIKSPHGDVWPIDYPLVISGHIHKAHSPQKNIIYPGSSAKHNFGEEDNDTSILFINFDTLEFIKLNLDLPIISTIKVTYDSLLDTLEKVDLKPLQKLRVICEGPSAELNSIKKSNIFKNTPPGVVILLKETNNTELTEDEIEKSFEKYFDIFKHLIKNYDPELNYIYENVNLGKTFEEIFEEFIDNEEFDF